MYNHGNGTVLTIAMLILIMKQITCNDSNVTISLFNSTDKEEAYTNFSLTIYNDESLKDSVIRLDLEGSLCYFKPYFVNMFDFKVMVTSCDNQQILLIDDIALARNVQHIQQSLTPQKLNFKAIIYNNQQNISMIYQDLTRPFLLADNTTFHLLKEVNTDDTVRIQYSNISDLIDINMINNTTNCMLCACLLLLIWWNIYGFIILRNNITLLQRLVVLLPYFKFFFCCVVIYYVRNISVVNKNITYDDNLSKIYFTTVISTFSAIYKTLFWFILILISNGWHIFTNSLNSFKMSNYICAYMSIYLIICVDQLLDIGGLSYIEGLYVSICPNP
jgi:hypothetical protein